jgi:hypothetical protein
VVELAPDPVEHRVDEGVMVDPRPEGLHVEEAVDDRILEVVHRVGDVVGEVHDLRLDAEPPLRGPAAHPREHVEVVGVEAELVAPAGVANSGRLGPRVLAAGVEARAGQVEAVARAVRAEHLRLEPGEQPQGLRVALEPADVGCPLGQRAFPVVAERRMPDVVGEAGGVDHVGVESEAGRQFAADLRDLE